MGSERTFNLNLLVSVVNCSLNNLKYILHNRVVGVVVRTADLKIPRQESVVARPELYFRDDPAGTCRNSTWGPRQNYLKGIEFNYVG